eukprot:TRINITY_DN22722_c0_g1_i1.p1 TRINITY_DN22722_c0_g1~~TRINITY_DN22722_c0_g1_i1.p1  ORF type:complete len:797 (+),score=148.43 TRINITY_DN22722_c0_g1_i1:96-2393(+)
MANPGPMASPGAPANSGEELVDLTLTKPAQKIQLGTTSAKFWFCWSVARETSKNKRQPDRHLVANNTVVCLLQGYKPSSKKEPNITRNKSLQDIEKVFLQPTKVPPLCFIKFRGGEPTWKLEMNGGQCQPPPPRGGVDALVYPIKLLNAARKRFPEFANTDIPCVVVPPHEDMAKNAAKYGPFHKGKDYTSPEKQVKQKIVPPKPPPGPPELSPPPPPKPQQPTPQALPPPVVEEVPPVMQEVESVHEAKAPTMPDPMPMPEAVVHTLKFEGEPPTFLPRDICISPDSTHSPHSHLPPRQKEGVAPPSQHLGAASAMSHTYNSSAYPHPMHPPQTQPASVLDQSSNWHPKRSQASNPPSTHAPAASPARDPSHAPREKSTSGKSAAGTDVPSVHLELVLKDGEPWAGSSSPKRSQVVDDQLPIGTQSSCTLGLAPQLRSRSAVSASPSPRDPPSQASRHGDVYPNADTSLHALTPATSHPSQSRSRTFAPRVHASAARVPSRSPDGSVLPLDIPQTQGPGSLPEQPSLGPVVSGTLPFAQMPARHGAPPVEVMHMRAPRAHEDSQLDSEVAQALLEHARALEERVRTLEAREHAAIHSPQPRQPAHPVGEVATQFPSRAVTAAAPAQQSPRGESDVASLVRSVQRDIDATASPGLARAPYQARVPPRRGVAVNGVYPVGPHPNRARQSPRIGSPLSPQGSQRHFTYTGAASPRTPAAVLPQHTPVESRRAVTSLQEATDVKKNFWQSFLNEWDHQQAQGARRLAL